MTARVVSCDRNHFVLCLLCSVFFAMSIKSDINKLAEIGPDVPLWQTRVLGALKLKHAQLQPIIEAFRNAVK